LPKQISLKLRFKTVSTSYLPAQVLLEQKFKTTNEGRLLKPTLLQTPLARLLINNYIFQRSYTYFHVCGNAATLPAVGQQAKGQRPESVLLLLWTRRQQQQHSSTLQVWAPPEVHRARRGPQERMLGRISCSHVFPGS